MTRRLLAAALAWAVLLLIAAPARAEWRWPVTGDVITPYRFGGDPFAAGQHRGIDIAAEQGAPVLAATPGEVRFTGTVGSSGLTIGIRTADGSYDTSYLHLSSASVREGQQVAAGQRVGAVGTTGERSAAQPHLHFGVRDAGTAHGYHDPLGFLPPPAGAPRGPRGAPAPHAVPVTAGPGGAPGRAPDPLRAPLPQPARSLRTPTAEPILPGWAIACAALLGTAVLLGLSASGRSASGPAATRRTTTVRTPNRTGLTSTPGRRRIAALLKPRLEAR